MDFCFFLLVYIPVIIYVKQYKENQSAFCTLYVHIPLE